MKAKGKHPDKALTAVGVRNLTTPGRYADGNGLYLVVDETGAKRWMLRTVVHGRRRDLGLGGLSLVSLVQARDKALEYRRIARSGGDPLELKRRALRVVPTFSEAAKLVHQEHKANWKNGKHQDQWINTLEQYAFPTLGDLRLDCIETPDVLRVLSPIWLTKRETARRVRQRIRTVLDWAKAAGHRTGENPVDGVTKGLPKQSEAVEHHSALPYADVPGFTDKMRASSVGALTKLAFEFLILTAARTGEVIGARWEEIDLENQVWTIPGSRMKAGRQHRVPLTARCTAILKQVKSLVGESDWVFPGRGGKRAMSNMAFLMALRRMEVHATAHGFRSAFRDWAAEQTNFSREVCEMALAHAVESKVEAAYRRGDLFQKRREIMNAWADYVAPAGDKEEPGG